MFVCFFVGEHRKTTPKNRIKQCDTHLFAGFCSSLLPVAFKSALLNLLRLAPLALAPLTARANSAWETFRGVIARKLARPMPPVPKVADALPKTLRVFAWTNAKALRAVGADMPAKGVIATPPATMTHNVMKMRYVMEITCVFSHSNLYRSNLTYVVSIIHRSESNLT